MECNPDEVFFSSITLAEMEYGASKSQYREKIGKVIDPYDMQIAAQGLSRNLTVITNNYDEFSRIPEVNYHRQSRWL